MLQWIEELEDDDAANVGAKMARLGTLRRLGLEVPDGFAVTVDAFRQFLAHDGLDARIDACLAQLAEPDDLATTEQVSKRIRALVEGAPVDASLSATIGDAYEELCFRCFEVEVPVAVRSSATGEDSAETSFAGQYESYLGIAGKHGVIDAVRRVWSSLFVARAITYRARHRLAFRDTPMAVGIVRLVHARCAGVAFSAHPVTRKRDRIVVEGSWGWGEAVVQGLVEPDHVEIDKETGRVLDYATADKRVISTFSAEDGIVGEREMPERFRNTACLTDDILESLWQTVCRVERHYRVPIDIEWAVERNWRKGLPIAVVQARPITALGLETDRPDTPKWDPLSYASRYGMGLKPR